MFYIKNMSSIEYSKQIDINKQSRETEIQSINANVDQKLLEKKLFDFVNSNKNLPNDEYSQLFINH